MSDLVERLRQNPNYRHWLVIAEAADRIEELEKFDDDNREELRLADTRIAELEAEVNYLLMRESNHLELIEELETESHIYHDQWIEERAERKRLQVEVERLKGLIEPDYYEVHLLLDDERKKNERLRDALLEITEMPCGEGDDSAGMKYIALQALAAAQEDGT